MLAFVDLPRGEFLGTWSAGDRSRRRAARPRYPEMPGSRPTSMVRSIRPDGAWLYVNTEEFASRPGHAQLARVPAKGGPMERLVESESVDWFPHLSPDGELASYISFPPARSGIRPTWT